MADARRAPLLLAPLAALVALVPARADRPKPTGAPPARGLVLRLPVQPPAEGELTPAKLLAELPDQGATHVALVVELWQRDATSAAPARHPVRSPSDRAITDVLEKARALGLEAALLPVLQLEQPGDDGRATLRPPDWAAWFAGYRRELLHWARLAEDGGASIFSVGADLASADGQGPRWRALIADVRRCFSGTLTYAAGWQRPGSFPAWADLDAIAVQAWEPLARKPGASGSELATAAQAARERLLAWRREAGLRQPLLLEAGFPSLEGAATRPWDGVPAGRGLDREEQRRCYEAFTSAWSNVPELAGCFLHEWGEGGERDRGHSPRGKPAQEVLRTWFGAPPPRPKPATDTAKAPPPGGEPDGPPASREQR